MGLFKKTKIIAIASGKGGVGKSVLSINIASGLAMLQKKVIMIDADFGGSNLNALLNAPPQGAGIKNLVAPNGGRSNGNGTIQETPISNLWLVHGWDYPGIYGLKKERILKLNSYLDKMNADYVLMDLSPGVSQNVIDLFEHSDIGVIVVTPEITSILNALVLIRFITLKKIFRSSARNGEAIQLIKTALAPSSPTTIAKLLDSIKEIDIDIWQNVAGSLREFVPSIIINRVGNVNERKIEKQFYDYLTKNYSITPNILGWLKESGIVVDSVKKRLPFVIDHPDSEPAGCIKIIIHKLLNGMA